MTRFSHNAKTVRRRLPAILSVLLVVLMVVIITVVLIVRKNYENNLRPLNASQKAVQFVIPSGASAKQIAVDLEEGDLIRSAWAFEWYVRTNDLRESLLAGTYNLHSNMSVQEIVDTVTLGKIATDLVTIPPGIRIDQVRQALNEYGFSAQAIDDALDANNYSDHPALVDKPADANLEGYLFPESFQKSSQTTPTTIIRLSLDEMQKRLTPTLRADIVKQGLTIHQGIIIASIIEQEVSNPDDKPKVAQVFLKRFKQGMKLGSDVTAAYGAIVAGRSELTVDESIDLDTPYNTRIRTGLPPGPISNVSDDSLQAVAYPSNTDFLFFVAGDDGTTHFAKTFEGHEDNIEKYCTTLCGR